MIHEQILFTKTIYCAVPVDNFGDSKITFDKFFSKLRNAIVLKPFLSWKYDTWLLPNIFCFPKEHFPQLTGVIDFRANIFLKFSKNDTKSHPCSWPRNSKFDKQKMLGNNHIAYLHDKKGFSTIAFLSFEKNVSKVIFALNRICIGIARICYKESRPPADARHPT